MNTLIKEILQTSYLTVTQGTITNSFDDLANALRHCRVNGNNDTLLKMLEVQAVSLFSEIFDESTLGKINKLEKSLLNKDFQAAISMDKWLIVIDFAISAFEWPVDQLGIDLEAIKANFLDVALNVKDEDIAGTAKSYYDFHNLRGNISSDLFLSLMLTEPDTDTPYVSIGKNIGNLVTRKQKAYGNAFQKVTEMMMIMYPNGIHPSQYQDILTQVRMLDKHCRIAAAKEDLMNEDPWMDLAGYAINELARKSNKNV